jgi:ABC-type transport system involved in multi-copper enzyme maturation permease subunit
MTFSSTTYFIGVLLVLLQILAALPWVLLSFFGRDALASWKRKPFARDLLPAYGIVLAVLLLAPVVFPYFVHESKALEVWGQIYAAVLQIQLLLDAFIGVFALLLLFWPKGGAIALAAFREGLRQPMFWLLFGVAFVAMSVSPLIPYFTFGEDHLMVKLIGYDTIMMAAAVFGALAASMSISEEIEGRTAVTLMSKPVSRRQFLVGKFLGIALAAGVLFVLLGTYFEGIVLFKHWWDKMDPEATPLWVVETLQQWALPGVATDFLRGVGLWTHLTLDTAPGLILGFAQVMVLIAIAVTLATRVPMVVNLVVVVVIFNLAHLTPVLVSMGYQAQAADPGSAVSQILAFMAQLLDTLLPDLDLFRLDPSLLSETPLAAVAFTRFLGSVSLYGLLYTSIVMLFGLILFEDRDLA